MKSDVINLSDGSGILSKILNETEKVSGYCSLDKKQSGRLRLLAEELYEMLPELLSFSAGEFWIENDGKSFELHAALTPNVALTMDRREKLLELSSNGKNAAAVGIMAKIRLAAEFMMIDYGKNAAEMPNEFQFFSEGLGGAAYFSMASWSLDAYRQKVNENQGEKWDELERSIIANIADEVLVGIQGKKVEIIVKKSF